MENAPPIFAETFLDVSTNHTELGVAIITPGREGGPLNVTMRKHATEVAGQRRVGVSFRQPMDFLFTTFLFARHPSDQLDFGGARLRWDEFFPALLPMSCTIRPYFRRGIPTILKIRERKTLGEGFPWNIRFF